VSGWSSRDVLLSVDASGEAVLLHVPSGTYLGLDRTAALIVELLNDDPDQAHAASSLSKRFGIGFDQALADVGAVVENVRSLSAARMGRGRRPTVTGFLAVARSWLRQPWRTRITIIEVATVVLCIELGLKLTDVSRLARRLHVPLASDSSAVPIAGPDDVSGLSLRERRVYWSVNWVMARWLFDGTCLRRALTFGWFLRRREPVLRLGMIDDEGHVAHAWIEVGGQAFDTREITRTFVSGQAQRDETSRAKSKDGEVP